jgi:hypothetical protein
MELVPIIFTTLKIVLVAAILVIGFSYISYKIKLKKGIIEQPGRPLKKTAEIAEKSVKSIINRITKPVPPPEPLLQNPLFKSEENKQKKPIQKEAVKKKKEVQKPESNSERIEIVKSLTPKASGSRKILVEKKAEIQNESKTESNKNKSTLGDQILDKYAEDDKSEMFTLNIHKKDSNKNK